MLAPLEVVYTGSVGAYTVVSALVAVGIPILVDLVTKKLASARLKAMVLIVLSALNGFLTEYVHSVNTNVDFHVDSAAMTAIMSIVVSAAMFFSVWKPTGISGADGVVQKLTPAGLGAERTGNEQGAVDVAYVLIIVGLVLVVVGLLTSWTLLWLGAVLAVVGGIVHLAQGRRST